MIAAFSRVFAPRKVYLPAPHVKTRINADFGKITAKKKPAGNQTAGFFVF
jgi:hypothetical protein